MSKKEYPEDKEVKVTSKQDKDVFEAWQEVCIGAIDETSRTQAQYLQAITNLQQEYTDTCKKLTEVAFSATKEFTNTIWGSTRFPMTFKAASDVTDIFTKTTNASNKVIISGIDIARQNLRMFNENIESFARLNANLIKTWTTFLASTRQ